MEADREVAVEETEGLMDTYPEIFAFIETSAKENTNVEEPFVRLAKVLVVSIAGERARFLLTLASCIVFIGAACC